MDNRFAYDAVIEVVTKHIIVEEGKTPHEELNFTLAEVGMGYDTAFDAKLCTETNFRQRVFAVARSLEKAYEFWPDYGVVSVNTKFIKEGVNV